MNHKPLEIIKIKEEGNDIRTFLFNESIDAFPGQFVMAWIPGVAEKPFSLSYTNPLGLTVKKQKKDPSNQQSALFTSSMFDLKEGDKVWISGPRGNGFVPIINFVLSDLYLIGGGTGTVPLALFGEYVGKYSKGSKKVTSFLGAKSFDELIFEERLSKIGEVHVATEDVSKGFKGLITDALKQYKFDKESNAAICGPEKMSDHATKILSNYLKPENIYISLERYMKCGLGLCGSCDFGGYRVCVDGPVFAYSQIKDIPDFGKFKRDRCRRKEFL